MYLIWLLRWYVSREIINFLLRHVCALVSPVVHVRVLSVVVLVRSRLVAISISVKGVFWHGIPIIGTRSLIKRLGLSLRTSSSFVARVPSVILVPVSPRRGVSLGSAYDGDSPAAILVAAHILLDTAGDADCFC